MVLNYALATIFSIGIGSAEIVSIDATEMLQVQVRTQEVPKLDSKLEHHISMHGMDADQRDETISNMRAFIEGSDGGFATLVVMGDSTMAGVVTELLNISEEVWQSQEIVYVSNDRARPVNYGCNKGCGGVPPGTDWKAEELLTDPMIKTTVEQAEESTKMLHNHGCKSGGGLETYVYRSGPYKNLVIHHWGFLPEYAEFCWKPCMADAMAALKPTAVLWNIGLHLLNHDFKPSICNIRHNPTKPGCGNHQEMVKSGTEQMLSAGIRAVVWKHTNWVCEARQRAGFPMTGEALDRWHNVSNLVHLEKNCEKDCPQYKAAGMKCKDWFFDAHTTTRMYLESKKAVQELRQQFGNERVYELDSYNITRDCCDRGCAEETDDGEHYEGLDSEIAVQFVRRLRHSAGFR